MRCGRGSCDVLAAAAWSKMEADERQTVAKAKVGIDRERLEIDNNLFEKTLAEIMAPKAKQSVLLGEKLLKHLGTESYLTTHIFPVFDLPFRLDANNEVIDLFR